jgi:hypothetical protein
LYVRQFATRFPEDAAVLVLVDSADEKQLTNIIAPGLKPELYLSGTMSRMTIIQVRRCVPALRFAN